MIKLTETIVRRPVAAVIIILGIVVFGAMALLTMPQELTPEMEIPMLVISTVYPGAGPEDVERTITRDIEEAVGSLSGVSMIISQSMENVSLVIIQYEYGIDIQNAYADAKERMDISVTSGQKANLLRYVEDEVIPQLDKLSAVSSVDVFGGIEEYVRVEVMEEMLREYGVTMQSVISAVSDVDYSAPLGSAGFGDQDLSVRTQMRYETLDAMRNIPVPLRNGDAIRLSDVAEVFVSMRDAESISRYNGNENISISISKRQSASAVDVARDVARSISAVTAADPDVEIHTIYDASERITSSINSIATTMILAVALSMVVLFLFFGDLRASLIVGSSMPVSLLITFILMNLMGYSLNVVSMSGLVLGVGMMVDNAIVVIDSCFKSGADDKSFTDAAVDGTKFVLLSIFAGTLTTVVVFVPLAMIEGMSGQLFGPLGFSVVFALLASLFSAITLVPLFFVRFKPIEKENAPAALLLKRVESGYSKLLRSILPKKKTVVAVTLAFLTLSLFLATKINYELMPPTDAGIVDIGVETKPGLKLEKVSEILAELETMVAAHPDVERYSLTGGGGGLTGGGNTLTAYLYEDRQMDTVDVIEQWRRETSGLTDCDIDIQAGSEDGMSFSLGDTVDVVLMGDDLDNTREAVSLVEDVLKQRGDLIRVSSTMDRASPQAEIAVDPLKAAAKNLTPQLISASVYTALNGSETSDVRIDSQKYSIWVEYPKGRYESLNDVADMLVVSSTGASVPLSEVAEVRFSDTPQTIVRQEGQFVVTISCTPTQAARFIAAVEIPQTVAALALPQGVELGQSTQTEQMVEEFTSLGMAIATAILLVFMVMAIQFESIRHSVMVMTCIPFAAIGSFSLMYFTDTTISMVSLLGFLVLVGTVVNNGILFVDTTNRYRRSMELHTALVYTGRTRLRPILMTTLTTILSMLPLAFGMGDGAEMMSSLGVTVIGGLAVSTLLTLLVLPTFYLVLDGKKASKQPRPQETIST